MATIAASNDFFSAAAAAGDKDAIDKLTKLFHLVGLPIPQAGQFFVPSPNVHSIYLPHGITLSLIAKPFGIFGRMRQMLTSKSEDADFTNRNVSHPLILQPAAMANFKRTRLEALPGIQREHPIAAESQVERLAEKLIEDGVFVEPEPDDIGVIDRNGRIIHLLINRNKLSHYSGDVSAEQFAESAQSRTFAPIASRLRKALAPINKPCFVDLDPHEMEADRLRAAFDFCRSNVSLDSLHPARVLFPHWKQSLAQTPRREAIKAAANAYAAACALHVA